MDKTSREIFNMDSNDGVQRSFKKKLSLSTFSLESDTSPLFCISVDGSTHADLAFDIVTREFSKIPSRMMGVYIYNSKLNDQFNYANKKENIIEKYGDKINRLRKSINFVLEDRNLEYTHALQQVTRLADTVKANYLIAGYYGIKGPKSENTELTKGINYLLSSCYIPTIIIKDITLRIDKMEKGYNWLFVFDRQYINSIKCLRAFLPLIDKDKDYVHGLTLSDELSHFSSDDVKNDFMNEIEEAGIKNYQYESGNYQRFVSSVLAEKINFGSVLYDFLVFYNNSQKHKTDGNNSESAKIVKFCNCSICFYSI